MKRNHAIRNRCTLPLALAEAGQKLRKLQHESAKSACQEIRELAQEFGERPRVALAEAVGPAEKEITAQLAQLSAERLRRIEHALIRLDEGSYGRCERCAGPIAPRRLRALPLATLCIDCQRDSEMETMRQSSVREQIREHSGACP